MKKNRKLFPVGVMLAVLLILVINNIYNGLFVTGIIFVYLVLSLAVNFAFMGNWKFFPITLCLIVLFSVVAIRILQPPIYIDKISFSAETLGQLDREVWEKPSGRILFSPMPDLWDYPLAMSLTVEDEVSSLSEVKAIFAESIGREVFITERPGYYDFGFRERSFVVQVR